MMPLRYSASTDTRNRPMFDSKEIEALRESVNESIRNQARQNVVLGNHKNLSHIAANTSGSLEIYKSRKFILIMDKPKSLAGFDWNEIRCCLCDKVIDWPAWYYNVKYKVNHFHYFVCFDSASPNKPSCKCYRRE
jgi:hypothetical protein